MIQLADLRRTFSRFVDRLGVCSTASSLAKGTLTIEKNGEVIAHAEFIDDEIKYKPTLRVVSDDDPEQEFEDEIPELTPEIMMKMFANMEANGLL